MRSRSRFARKRYRACSGRAKAASLANSVRGLQFSRAAGLTTEARHPYGRAAFALVAELVDALVSGTSGESRGGSSPLQGTKFCGAFLVSAAVLGVAGRRETVLD